MSRALTLVAIAMFVYAALGLFSVVEDLGARDAIGLISLGLATWAAASLGL